MRALVTGSTGFVGRYLVQALVEKGWEICCLVRRPVQLASAAVSQVSGDLLAPTGWSLDPGTIGKIDAVFHLGAALPTDAAMTPEQFLQANGNATLALLETCRKFDIERFVYLSSISVIGSPLYSPIDESHPLAPMSAYALGKATGELACDMARAQGLKAVALRLSSPYGVGMNGQTVLPAFLRRAGNGEPLTWHGSGSRSQDFIHVSDVVAASLLAAAAPRGGRYCLGSGEATSMKALAEQIVSLVPGGSAGASGLPDPQEGVSWQLDTRAIRNDLGFAPRMTLKDGLVQLMNATSPVNWIR